MGFRCSLCQSETLLFKTIKSRHYFACSGCNAVLLHSDNYPTIEEAKKRYLEHNNDVDDPRYQKYGEPIVNHVKETFGPNHSGLDFGAGTGPVITKLLRDDHYNISLYDPLFWNDPQKLETTYDYIVCTEVAEHFIDPAKEFKLLRSLLNKNGQCILKTHLYSSDINFERWNYKDDPTHVIFYHLNSLEWIKKSFDFRALLVSKSFIVLTV